MKMLRVFIPTLVLGLGACGGGGGASSEAVVAKAGGFELSAEASEVSWYLGVGVSHDWEKGTITLCQNKYVQDLLACVQMTDANPVITPMEVGQQLTSEDCPEVPYKQMVHEYQQIVGSLYYLV